MVNKGCYEQQKYRFNKAENIETGAENSSDLEDVCKSFGVSVDE